MKRKIGTAVLFALLVLTIVAIQKIGTTAATTNSAANPSGVSRHATD